MADKKKELNLIPEDQRVTSLRTKLLPFIFALIAVGAALGGFALLKAAVIAQNEALKKVNIELDSQTLLWQRLEPIGSAIKSVKSKKITYNQNSSKYSGLDKKLDKIRSLLPAGISLSSLDVDNDGNVNLSGQSDQADIVYQYINVLKEQKEIKNFSLSSISKTGLNYNFTLKFILTLK